MKYIETDRLVLRNWQQKDLPLFQQMNADAEVRRYFPDRLSYKRSEIVFQQMQRDIEKNNLGLFAVEEKVTGAFIGFIGMHLLEKNKWFSLEEMPFYEIGWRLRKEAWGKGYATEGAKAVLSYGRKMTDLPIFSLTSVRNLPSIRVMQKIGFSEYRTFNHPMIPSGHPLEKHVLYKDQI
ncbi:N-acetyltransferase [Macrococcus brunensis]|uniref:N-acetyltransferase n=1 Tax=Macrococcus brunensis TaxID=198483 RepID=A0A4R6BGG8_9STAP|nr:GNAT family N-acetyltransferase [Macrococcus brunensis]TDL98994.1 N-acetyltransferase [Macrococcus brunensis]ULG72475.1 GNAT family N-acetyltransferase [Macrococcus brunensis]ULG74729.1 GNAT family N-acetyltransferase [Macrococcus brunensis]